MELNKAEKLYELMQKRYSLISNINYINKANILSDKAIRVEISENSSSNFLSDRFFFYLQPDHGILDFLLKSNQDKLKAIDEEINKL